MTGWTLDWSRGIKRCAGVLGAVAASVGLLGLVLAATADFSQGRMGFLLSGALVLVFAAPAVAWPFSTRAARVLLVLAMLALAVGALWLTFSPQPGVTPPLSARIAVPAFAALVLMRIGLARRDRKRSR